MELISTPDLRNLDSRELAALQNEVLKGVAHAAENRRKGLVLIEEIGRARTERRVMRKNL